MRLACLAPLLAALAQEWHTAPPEALEPEAAAVLAANSLEASLADLALATGGYHPQLLAEELLPLLEDHLSAPRSADVGWERPPRRGADGVVCTAEPTTGRPTCEPADPEFCLGQFLPLLLRETHHALAFVKGHVRALAAAVQLSGTDASHIVLPPLSGRALASVQALDTVLGLYLGMLERVDFNPRLAACLGAPFGRRLRETVLRALEQQGRLMSEVKDMRWELAAHSRLAHARYGLQWHADTAHHIALQAGWALFELARLETHIATKLAHHDGAEALLRAEPTEVEAGSIMDWGLELRTALHVGGKHWHLDKGLLQFLLANVLRTGETVCDFGAFGGHYSQWLNDTGLVTAFAYDGLPEVEELTGGRVLHARLEDADLDLGPCDVALCIEVLEHIPREHEAAALRSLGRHARRALVASWAPPWVPGPGHVNGRTPEEARKVVENVTGLQEDAGLTAQARARAQVPWVAESVAVYGRPGG